MVSIEIAAPVISKKLHFSMKLLQVGILKMRSLRWQYADVI